MKNLCLLYTALLLFLQPNFAFSETEPEASAPELGFPQQRVQIRVDASQAAGPVEPIWRYFGYDEPNYTYTENGRKLVRELSESSYSPVYIRAHNLLTTGDGTPALKWGSTNAYTEDASGRPVYNWSIVDRILETYLNAGAKPFVEIGFMPEALSIHPEPYRHAWPNGPLDTGWSYPPADYKKWSELIFRWVSHCAQKYGQKEVESWYWEVWNEPDIFYWRGTPQDYDKLYDYTANAVKSALPSARIGGPASTGPSGAKAAAFLRQFLEHCVSGKNYATGTTGAPLDFISYHAKGKPELANGHVRMGLSKHLNDIAAGFQIVRGFPKLRGLPIVLSESDPEGCAACSARGYPQNAYRNGALYAAYVIEALDRALELRDRDRVNLQGMLTWAFEFEGQPYFSGFRTLATNGIDKPVLNAFRMAGLLRGTVVKIESTGALNLDTILTGGVRQNPDINALAARSGHNITLLAWNYHDADESAPPAEIDALIAGFPQNAARVLVRHYRIDRDYSNAYTAWQMMGSPQQPSPEQRNKLESAGQLQLLESPRWLSVHGGKLQLRFSLPRQAVSLIEISY